MDSDNREVSAQTFVNNYISLASFCLLYYDYILTLPDEVKYFWTRRKTNTVTILFLLNRYLALVCNIPVLLKNFGRWDNQTCDILLTYHQLYLVSSTVIMGVTLALRTHAFYCRSRWVLLIFAFLLLIGVGCIVWSVSCNRSHVPFTLGCQAILTKPEAIRVSSVWAALVLFDSTVFALTAYKGIQMWRNGYRGLPRVLLRDGTAYFLIMVTTNVSNWMSFFLAPPILQGFNSTFSNIISVILVSRLMIGIQEPLGSSQNLSSGESGIASTSTSYGIRPFITTIIDRDTDTLEVGVDAPVWDSD